MRITATCLEEMPGAYVPEYPFIPISTGSSWLGNLGNYKNSGTYESGPSAVNKKYLPAATGTNMTLT